MYTETIGRKILNIWREETERPEATAREYFDEVFFPLMFDHDHQLLFANNSPFAQNSNKNLLLESSGRRKVLQELHQKIFEAAEKRLSPANLHMGGSAIESSATTSGMLSNIETDFEIEHFYMSWIGLAAAIGTDGYNLLIDDNSVLRRTIIGWRYYRTYLSQTKGLKGRQIQTWNAWWLIISGETSFSPERPFDLLGGDDFISGKAGSWKLKTAGWIKVVFALSSLMGGAHTTAYVFNFGQSNTSVGFIGLRLNEVDHLVELYEELFGEGLGAVARERMVRLYETDLGFLNACRAGSIGTQQLRPKGLKNYVATGRGPGKKIRPEKDELTQNFYLTWLTAMLNNETLIQRADRLAEALLGFSTTKRGKKGNQSLVDKLLESYGVRQFADAATLILKEGEFERDDLDVDRINEVVEEVSALPASQFPLFVTFLRFKYAYRAHKS